MTKALFGGWLSILFTVFVYRGEGVIMKLTMARDCDTNLARKGCNNTCFPQEFDTLISYKLLNFPISLYHQ